MKYQDLIVKWRNDNVLVSALIELTYRCNLDCFFCYNDLELRGTPLTTEQYFKILQDLKAHNVLEVALSGGEPLAHPDFFAIGRKANELGFVIRLKSNGHALRGRLAQRVLDEVDPYLVEISLHGANAVTHDAQTRVKGSFDRLMGNLPELLDMGFNLKLMTTLTSLNENEIAEIYAIADRLGLTLDVDPMVTPRDNGSREPLAVLASKDGQVRFAALFKARQQSESSEQVKSSSSPVRDQKHCGTGSTSITIDPFGNVYPCVQWRKPAGNLHHQSIQEIWTGSSQLEEIRETSKKVKQVVAGRTCVDDGPCVFCPALAEQLTGSPFESYQHTAQEIAQRHGWDRGGNMAFQKVSNSGGRGAWLKAGRRG